MVKLRNIFALFILLGLIFAELLPAVQKYQPEAARSQANDDLLASLLQRTPTDIPAQTTSGGFWDITLPSDPSTISRDMQTSISLVYRPSASVEPSAPSSSYFLSDQPTSGYQPSALESVLPPADTPLAYAYQDDGRAWYQKGTNVLVIFPNETIRSFNTKTGQETSWLQDRLAYPPIQDANAITNYQTNYNAEIVAETRTWVLMEFPSGGVVKVARPQYIAPSGGNASSTLPTILPGYGG